MVGNREMCIMVFARCSLTLQRKFDVGAGNYVGIFLTYLRCTVHIG